MTETMSELVFQIADEVVIKKAELENMSPYSSKAYSSLEKKIWINENMVSFFTRVQVEHRNRLSVRLVATQPQTLSKRLYANVMFMVHGFKESVKCRELLITNLFYSHKYTTEPLVHLCSWTDLFDSKIDHFEDGKLVVKMHAVIIEKPNLDPPFNLIPRLWYRDDKDFVIAVGKDGEAKTEFKIHSIVLACASPVFDRMLHTNMKEKSTSRLDITDFEPEIVQIFIEFLYNIEEWNKRGLRTLCNLLRFADKYDIGLLKAKSESALYWLIFPNTVVDVVGAALLVNSIDLKRVCFDALTIYRDEGIAITRAEEINYEELELGLDTVQLIDDDFFD